jgi:regulation of enolase protein 1 (concanavalin A-like superfamily)
MGTSVYVGLAVSSHDNTRLAAATFDNVAVTSGPPPPPGTPSTPSPADTAIDVSTSPTLTWTASAATSYDVAFGTTNPPPIASAAQSNPSYAPGALTANTQYFWQVTAHNSTGTATGPVWSFTTAVGLPAPWQDGDIGAVGVAGSASYNNGVFSVSGSGADIWGSADAFHYVYQPLTGDGQLIARVASVQNVAAWTKAGVMIRDTMNPGSAYAFMLVSAAKGTALQYRTSAGAPASSIAGTSAVAPLWVKIVRAGTTFSAYQSADGNTWTLIGTATISMGSTVQIGLAVTSHNNAAAATATFDSVSQ